MKSKHCFTFLHVAEIKDEEVEFDVEVSFTRYIDRNADCDADGNRGHYREERELVGVAIFFAGTYVKADLPVELRDAIERAADIAMEEHSIDEDDRW